MKPQTGVKQGYDAYLYSFFYRINIYLFLLTMLCYILVVFFIQQYLSNMSLIASKFMRNFEFLCSLWLLLKRNVLWVVVVISLERYVSVPTIFNFISIHYQIDIYLFYNDYLRMLKARRSFYLDKMFRSCMKNLVGIQTTLSMLLSIL